MKVLFFTNLLLSLLINCKSQTVEIESNKTINSLFTYVKSGDRKKFYESVKYFGDAGYVHNILKVKYPKSYFFNKSIPVKLLKDTIYNVPSVGYSKYKYIKYDYFNGEKELTDPYKSITVFFFFEENDYKKVYQTTVDFKLK